MSVSPGKMFTKTVCARERQQYARAYVHGSRSTSGSTTGVVIAATAVAFFGTLWPHGAISRTHCLGSFSFSITN